MVNGSDGSERGSTASVIASGPSLAPMLAALGGLGLAASVLARAIAPALPGSGVGLGQAIRVLERVQGTAAQVFAMFGSVMAIALVLEIVRGRASGVLRAVSALLGGALVFCVLTTAGAVGSPLTLVVLATASSVLALVAAWDGASFPPCKEAALVLGAVGSARLLELVSVVSSHALSRSTASIATRGFAVASTVFVAIALLASLAWLAPRTASSRLTRPTTIVVLVLTLLITRHALDPSSEEGGVLAVLLRRAVERFTRAPEPPIPIAMATFAAVLAPIVGVAALLNRSHVPALSGVVALALMSARAPLSPLPALALALAALALPTAARDGRSMWAAIQRSEASRERHGARPRR